MTIKYSISEQMQDEYEAWRTFCLAFEEATALSINDGQFRAMVKAIVRWGEELCELRKISPISPEALKLIRDDAPTHPKVK